MKIIKEYIKFKKAIREVRKLLPKKRFMEKTFKVWITKSQAELLCYLAEKNISKHELEKKYGLSDFIYNW